MKVMEKSNLNFDVLTYTKIMEILLMIDPIGKNESRLLRCDLISRVKCIQMGLNSHLSTYVEDKTIPSKVVTGVVSATTSLMPKSERKEKYFLKEIE